MKMPVNNGCSFREIEIDAIRQDAYFCLDLALNLTRHQSSSILFFGLIPYLSLFVVESFEYLRYVFPDYARTLSGNHEKTIRASRMRIKYFDDSKKRVDGMFELYEWILQFHQEWHINKHSGFLARLKKLLQDDLGIFGYDGHVIGSTHVGILNLGYEKEDLPEKSSEISNILSQLSYSLSKEIGAYLRQVCAWPEFSPNGFDTSYFEYRIRDEYLGYKDEKAGKFLARVFNGAGSEGLNFSLLVFLTAVNYFIYILQQLVFDSSTTLFKLKYITLYHVASSLRKLQSYCYPKGRLSDRSKDFFKTIFDDRDFQRYSEKSKFRNILVHYKIDDVPAGIINPDESLYGLVEYFFDGDSYATVNCGLNKQLERLSALLEEWLNWQVTPSQFNSWQFESRPTPFAPDGAIAPG
ncbi:MAG: hypothetical protein ACE5D4_08630 [Thermodesulfobacteriota bacterium]